MSHINYSKYWKSAKCLGFCGQFRVKYVTCWWNNVLRSSLSVIDGPGKWTIQCHIFPSLHAIFSPCSAFWSNCYKKNIRKFTFCYYQKFIEYHRVLSLYVPDNNNQTQIASDIYIGGHFLILSAPIHYFDLTFFGNKLKVFTQKHGFFICWA